MNWILVLLVVAILAMFIFWTNFRNWVGRQLSALWDLLVAIFPNLLLWLTEAFRVVTRIVGIYSMILGSVSLFALILIIIALLINAPGFTAFAFVSAISVVLLTWIPAGVVLKVFRVNKAVVPKTMKTFIAWVAFVGFLGLMMPGVLTFKSLMGAALVGFILLGVTTKINAIDKIVFPLVIVMCLSVAWKHFFPEDFRAKIRYGVSWSKKVNTIMDRGSINNETDAATTYAIILRDVNTLYDFPAEGKPGTGIPESIIKNLPKGTIVKISSHKQEVKEFDGQGFVRIQLANANGSFVLGKKHWIEAEYVQIATPREITPKDDSLLPSVKNHQPKTQNPSAGQTSMVKDSIFTKGVYTIDVKGQTPFNIVVVSSQGVECHRYSLQSPTWNYQILIPGMQPIQAGPTATLPYLQRPVFKLASQSGDTVTLTVV